MPKKKTTKQTTQGFANREDVESLASEMNQTFLECRELGHSWRRWTAYRGENGTIVRGLKCSNCHGERWQDLTEFGHVIRERRNYPEGYLAPAGFGRIISDGKDALRAESLRRDLIFSTN